MLRNEDKPFKLKCFNAHLRALFGKFCNHIVMSCVMNDAKWIKLVLGKVDSRRNNRCV